MSTERSLNISVTDGANYDGPIAEDIFRLKTSLPLLLYSIETSASLRISQPDTLNPVTSLEIYGCVGINRQLPLTTTLASEYHEVITGGSPIGVKVTPQNYTPPAAFTPKVKLTNFKYGTYILAGDKNKYMNIPDAQRDFQQCPVLVNSGDEIFSDFLSTTTDIAPPPQIVGTFMYKIIVTGYYFETLDEFQHYDPYNIVVPLRIRR